MTTDKTGSAKPESSDDAGDDKPVVQNDLPNVPTLPVGVAGIDLSALPEEQRQALQVEYARGMLEIDKRAKELGVDVMALDRTLRTMAENTQAASANDNAVTITNAQENSIGRTEIIMGNTQHALKGKLSANQAGRHDMQPYLVGLGIAGVIVIGILIARG